MILDPSAFLHFENIQLFLVETVVLTHPVFYAWYSEAQYITCSSIISVI